MIHVRGISFSFALSLFVVAGCGDVAIDDPIGQGEHATSTIAADDPGAAIAPSGGVQPGDDHDGGQDRHHRQDDDQPGMQQSTCPYAPTYADITGYPDVSGTTRMTAGGVVVYDPSAQIVDGELDKKTAELASCLAGLPGKWGRQESEDASCLSRDVVRTMPAACLKVRLAPDWHVSSCSGEQLFACDVDPQVCADKGLVPMEGCPCECRASLQDGWVVVTPNLKLYKAELARLVTGCNNPWKLPDLARCL